MATVVRYYSMSLVNEILNVIDLNIKYYENVDEAKFKYWGDVKDQFITHSELKMRSMTRRIPVDDEDYVRCVLTVEVWEDIWLWLHKIAEVKSPVDYTEMYVTKYESALKKSKEWKAQNKKGKVKLPIKTKRKQRA